MNKHNLPDRDEEILRNMYAKDYKYGDAYTCIKFKHEY